MINIDATLKNADWPKRTPDTFADLGLVKKWDEAQHPRGRGGRFTETASITVEGREIAVVKPRRAEGDTLVLLDVAKADADFAQSQGFYIGKGGAGGISNRYARFGEFITANDSIEAPEMYIDAEGRVSFTNGRHRWAWLRDHGVKAIPVALQGDGAKNAKKHGYLVSHSAFAKKPAPPAVRPTPEAPTGKWVPNAIGGHDYVQKGEHKFGSTQIQIAPHSSAALSLNYARSLILDSDTMADGKDVDPNHLTVRYGIQSPDVEALREFITRQEPFTANVRGVTLFPASEHSDGAVPVVANIESPELLVIEKEIGKYADFKEKSFPVYRPHCTLAYCKPEAAEKYKDLHVDGTFVVQEITISHASGVKETIPFSGAYKYDPNQARDAKGRFVDLGLHGDQVTVLHGTTRQNAEAILAVGFRPGNPAAVAAQVEHAFGLPKDSILNHTAFEFAKGRIDLDEVHFTTDEDVADQYAIPEVVQDALSAAHSLLHPDTGKGIREYNQARKQWIAEAAKRFGEPALLSVTVPFDVVGQHSFGKKLTLPEFQEIQAKYPGDQSFFNNIRIPITALTGARIQRRKWDESKHKRKPKGSSTGGEFTSYHGVRDAIESVLNGETVNIDRDNVRRLVERSAEQVETVNLTHVNVEGMKIFGGEGMGIKREEMPQIPKDHRENFLKEMYDLGVTVTKEMVDPLSLKPTQNEISAQNVAEKLIKYEQKGKEFPPVLVSSDNRILDGHHHWGIMAVVASESPTAVMPIYRLNIPAKTALARMHAYDKKYGIKRKAIGEVKKLDASSSKRYVTPFVSFDQQGEKQLQLIASLNSSRLATWGFTAEAEVRGMARYRITAVLDGRTSDFCRMISGKIFNVPDARKKVIEVLNVQNPEDLKTVQPWPKQTKAAIAEFEEMSAAELTALGFHIPPYHPYCRTICRPIESSVGELDEPVATVPAEAETFQPVTAADLKELGLDATEEQVAQWNEHVGMTPVELLSKFSGLPPQEVMTKPLGVGSNPIRFDDAGNIGFKVNGVTPAGVEFKLGAILDPFTGIYYLTQAQLLAGTPVAELNFMKNMFSSLIEMGLKSSAKSVAVGVAGNAAYYAKLGFLPDEMEWESLSNFALEGNSVMPEVLASLAPLDRLLVEQLLQDKSVSAMSALVELPFRYKGKTIGEWLFGEASGTWALDLTDSTLVAQALEYLS